jgi:pyruvate/2-oxoglutarate dehydrogenase complex dihydrolipoamide dehydrogenase (E3) component
MSDERFDAVVLGSGQAGVPLAKDLAKAGQSVAIVESWHIGGTCVNVGCTPSKTLAASARVAYLARRSSDFGISAGEIGTDMPAVIARKRQIVEKSNTSNIKGLEKAGVTIVMGEGSFAEQTAAAGEYAIAVKAADGTERRLVTKQVFLNTGERPVVPALKGLDSVPFLDSTSIMELEEVPDHLIVLGAGIVALEFAQMFHRFGSAVTVIERGTRLLPHEDEDICSCARDILLEDGLKILFETEAAEVSGTTGSIRLKLKDGKELHGTHLLVAIGRRPNVESLHLDRVGVKQNEHGYIEVNDLLETGVPGIWALGDVKGPPAFTHVSYDDYRIVAANLLHKGSRRVSDRTLVYTIYTDPEIGRVGMNEMEARSAGKKIRVASIPMSYMARAQEMAESRGMLKAIVEDETDLILGASIVGVEGGEVIAQIQLAMLGGLKYTVLRDAVFSHPTKSEVLNTLFMSLES